MKLPQLKLKSAHLIPFLLLGIASAQAQTATLNIDELNQKSQEQVQSALEAKEEAEQLKEMAKQEARDAKRLRYDRKRTNALRDFKDSIQVGQLPKTLIAAPRSLQEGELAQANLIACVEKVMTRNSGGYLKFKIAQDLLLAAMDNNGWLNDSVVTANAESSCEEAFSRLQQYKTKDLEKARLQDALLALPVNNAAQNKAGKLIHNLISKDFVQCELTQLRGNAAVVMGVGVELNLLRCLMTNGSERNYAGPGAYFGFGIGASVTLDRKTLQKQNQVAHGVFVVPRAVAAHLVEFEDVMNSSLGAGAVSSSKEIRDHREIRKSQNSIGASLIGTSVDLNQAIRLPNSPRHWDTLVDLLK